MKAKYSGKKILIIIISLLGILQFKGFSQLALNSDFRNNHEHPDFFKHHYDYKLVNDTSYDVKFYHLDLDVSVDSPFISGKVYIVVEPLLDNFQNLKLDLSNSFVVDSVTLDASSYSFNDSILEIFFFPVNNGKDLIHFNIYYHGEPKLYGDIKGMVYASHGEEEPVIATLSTPYLAHYWYPCKDGPEDKADSVYIDITIKDTSVNEIPLIAVSNGILESVEVLGGKKKFMWRHRYPIVPYYVMLAISNYTHFQQTAISNGVEFPVDYYVFSEELAISQEGVSDVPDAINFFSEIYGPYPFLNEKYGMTQLGFYGAIENQTNTIANKMSLDWYFTTIHELAHMWFGDMITCDNWHHGWINEGFATYSEALWYENLYGLNAYYDFMDYLTYFNGGTLYLNDIEDPLSIFVSILYNKGAYLLHMLRKVLGDEVFFTSMLNFATDERFKYAHASTEDFQGICEEQSGEELTFFFNQWVYDEYYPIYYYNYEKHNDNKELHFAIEQKQGQLYGWRDVFVMPIDVKVNFIGGKDTTITVFNDSVLKFYTFSFDDIIVNIQIDPNQWILCDTKFDSNIPLKISSYTNNQYVSLYPNPSNGIFNISIPDCGRKNMSISIYDLNGTRVHFRELNLECSNTINVMDNNLKGFYILEIQSNTRKHYKRLIFN